MKSRSAGVLRRIIMADLKRILTLVGLAALAGLVLSGGLVPVSRCDPAKVAAADWQKLLEKRLPVYGHRNWIVITDAAYPSQSRQGIETVATGADQLEVVKYVLDQLGKTKHVRPTVYLDAELPHVRERDAPGVGEYRKQLKKLLGARKAQSVPHEQVIDRLDKAAEKFHVLILKTNLTIPYTSVFLELGCGYWGDEAEQRLRRLLRDSEER
jgi:hypothetical protein